MSAPNIDDVKAAARRLHGIAIRTPLLPSRALSEKLDARIFLKPENLQHTGSFKFRGAYNALSQIADSKKKNGVLAVSSGNHAQGVAEAGRLLGIPITIIMPSDAPEVKIQRTKASGADVVLYDRAKDDRDALADELLQKTGATFVHPFNNKYVIAGQGTAGLEIVTDMEALGLIPDVLLVCTGGGGFTAGLTLACKNTFPDLQVFSVEPEGFDDYRRSLISGKAEINDKTHGSVCDAILTPSPGEIGLEITQPRLSGGLVVSDQEALQAVRYGFEQHRLVLEPGGAVAFAAVLSGKLADQIGPLKGKTVVATLSGGNVDQAILARALATG